MAKECVLEIIDEVNIRFHGLDAMTRRSMANELKFFIPHAVHTPAYKLGRWDGTVRYCDIGARSYLNLLDRLIPIAHSAGYHIELLDKRLPHQVSFLKVSSTSYSHITWPIGHEYAGQPIVLRDYQVDYINSFLDSPQGVSVAPTGAGKTICTAVLADKIGDYGRSIVIVPTKDLVTQTEEDFINLGLDVGVYYGDRKEYYKQHTICTWQSLEVLNKKSKYYDPDFSLADFIEGTVGIVVDECFSGDMRVLTPTGYVPISQIKKDDVIINYDMVKGVFKEDIVMKVHENLYNSHNEDMFELEFDNGNVIEVTGNHKFLTKNRGWVRADELTVADNVVEFDN